MDLSPKPLTQLLAGLALALSGCVGTDFVADPPPAQSPARLEINQVVAALEVGQTTAFTATYFDETGTPSGDVEITWSSSDPAIASIDPQGVVQGLQPGQINIVAAVGPVQSDPIMVGIVSDPTQLAMVQATPLQQQLAIGQTLQLNAQGTNAQGEALDGPTYTWSTSDPSLVEIDADGLATALAPGRAQLTASADGITSNAVQIQVVGDGRSGTFVKKPGTSYQVRGTATLQNAADTGLELKFDSDFAVSSGPRLHAFLSTNNSVGPTSVDLGQIQSFSGAQTYQVPTTVELSTYDWVVIHCVPFNVTFGFAQLD